MSKTLNQLEHLRQEKAEKPQPESPFSKWVLLAWLLGSIGATFFSYQLGVRQGMQAAQKEQPAWLYYFNENLAKTPSVPVPAPPATAAEPQKKIPPAIPAKIPEKKSSSGYTIQVVT